MNEVTKYQCEICGKLYDTSAKCEECENYHKSVNSVTYQYTPKDVGLESLYPHTAILTMSDGKKITMKRVSIGG